MCTGATSGLAVLKFSTSPSTLGVLDTIIRITIAVAIEGMESLIEYSG